MDWGRGSESVLAVRAASAVRAGREIFREKEKKKKKMSIIGIPSNRTEIDVGCCVPELSLSL